MSGRRRPGGGSLERVAHALTVFTGTSQAFAFAAGTVVVWALLYRF